MEAADLKYRKSLQVMEGMARVEVRDEIHDLDLITQASDEAMALRMFRNNIVEQYGIHLQGVTAGFISNIHRHLEFPPFGGIEDQTA